jgi:hypothetical protein
LLLDPNLDANMKWFTMRMIYGAQTDEHDFHYVGFDDNTLPSILSQHNFCNLKRVDNFNIHQDTSSMKYQGRAISLNIVGRKCGSSGAESLAEDPSSRYVAPNEADLVDA